MSAPQLKVGCLRGLFKRPRCLSQNLFMSSAAGGNSPQPGMPYAIPQAIFEAGSQAAQMQSLAHETTAGMNTNGARAAPMQSPCAAACRAVPAEHWMGTDASKHKNEWCTGCINAVPVCRWMDGCKTRCTGCSMQSPCAAACRAVPAEHWMGTDASKHKGRLGCLKGSPRNLRDDPGAHGNGWTQGQMQTRASRHGVKAEAGRQGMARQGRNRPLQHKQAGI